jgi:7-keto-8-aminopelargonate synthetase-like enzyme
MDKSEGWTQSSACFIPKPLRKLRALHPNAITSLGPPLQQVDRTYVLADGKKLSYFAGCDYFRLSSHPRVLAALEGGLKRYGLNVAASRMTTGNHEIYTRIEEELARFFAAQSAVLVSAGYLTNLVVAQAFAGEFSQVLIDERSHVSLFDAARAFGRPITRFRHRDVADVVRVLRRLGTKAKVILLTDGLFAHDGCVAPLGAYRRALPSSAWLLVDDAHGAGVLGRHGRGTLEYVGLDRTRVVQTITLSKAFGVYGGAILGPRAVRKKLLSSSLFIGNTPLPLPLVSAACEAIRLLATDATLRQRLARHTQRVK